MTTQASPQNPALRVAELLAWTIGLLLLALYFGARARQTVAADSGLREFERARRSLSWTAPDQTLWSPERVQAWRHSLTASKGTPLAVLKIPSINLEVPILEGTDEVTLDRGVGYIKGTARPGSPGNLGIAGHRDGFFRVLKDLAPGALIEVETLAGTQRYAVQSLFLVDPKDVWVLEQTPSPSLTLVTCFPFYYTGSAPHRYIIKALPTALP